MPTEKEVEAAARVMADLPSIDAPKLPAPCWMGSARSILEAAERERERHRRETCKHPRKQGTGMVCSDGSSESYWSCPDCLQTGHIRTPPRADGEGMRAMLSNNSAR
jgi:hypothetical protein